MRLLLDWLRDPLLDGMDVDGENRLALHRKMLEKKRMLREVFTDFHHLFRRLEQKFLSGEGANKVELGAGISPMRDSYPEVLATDIVAAPHLDKAVNAEAMDFPDESVNVIYGQNCFHHFPHPDRFFHELDRVLVPGGGAILLEPYYGPFATFLYKRLFRTEGFDKNYPSWETPVAGPMNGANQALSYIVFVRDVELYAKKHPNLKIAHREVAGNYLKYLLSGGLNFRQILPDSCTGLVGLLEKLISPLNRWIALHHVVVIRKKE
jgi:SAM-dependent methyltransferase